MYLLRRAAVRTALLQPSRNLSTLRAPSTRIASLQSSQVKSLRPFHQTRIWHAEGRPIVVDEASPSDATTTGETVPTEAPVETLEEAAVVEPFEREEVAEEFKEEAIEAAEVAEEAAEIAVEEAAVNEEGIEAAEGAVAAAQVAEEAAGIAEVAGEDVGFASQAEAQPGEVAATAAQTAQIAAEAATMSAAAAAVAPEFQQQQQPPGRRQAAQSGTRQPPSSPTAAPTRILYVGNLFFEVTAAQLEAEFGKFGAITNSRIVTDNRGLSKGFAYLEFAEQESADRAIRESDQRVFQGRRMAVQYHVRREPRRFNNERGGAGAGGVGAGGPSGARQSNPPSKTLFIGNMSYQMSDRDLNDLFREIRDVLDVRVAIDRRSGQPRGFAHADFVDVAAAERAKQVLENKVVYGRQLRVDFSGQSSQTRQFE